jgi:hemolysin D
MTDNQQEISGEDLGELDKFADKQSEASSYDQLLKLPIPNVSRVGIYFITLMMVVTIGGLYFGKVNLVVQATGLIRTIKDTFRIEAVESGMVTRILAEPGDRLVKDAPILHLDASERGLNLEQVRHELKSLENLMEKNAGNIRISAAILKDVDAGLARSEPVDLSGEMLLHFMKLKNRYLALQDAKTAQTQNVADRGRQRKKEIQLANEKIKTMLKNRAMTAEELVRDAADLARKKKMLTDFEKLTKEGYYSNVELNREQEQFKLARTEYENKRKGLSDTDLAISNERIRLNDLQIRSEEAQRTHKRQLRTETLAYRQALTQFREGFDNLLDKRQRLADSIAQKKGQLRLGEEQIKKTVIRMPFTGYIGDLKISNNGQMVSAGEVVTTAYPEGSLMEALVLVENKDIGLISDQTPVSIKVDAYAFKDFGAIPGRVERVIPNLSGKGGFAVVVNLSKQTLQKNGQAYPLFPGLTLKADFITQKIRLYQLIFKEMRDMYSNFERPLIQSGQAETGGKPE